MIVYVTKKTVERYKIDLGEKAVPLVREITDAVIQREGGDRLLEWGAKLFYFDRRKCLEVANFASKFTLFLIDIKVDDLPNIGNFIAHYLLYIYENDPVMTDLIKRYFSECPLLVLSNLTDKSIIAHLNHTLSDFAWDGYRLYDYIENNIMQSMKLNKYFNTVQLVTRMVDGKKEYEHPADVFKELLLARYQGSRRSAAPRSPIRPR